MGFHHILTLLASCIFLYLIFNPAQYAELLWIYSFR
nr:MAG TPA: hypothetical protein [Caudoviricetes sp.]